jgi:hypothetical protein
MGNLILYDEDSVKENHKRHSKNFIEYRDTIRLYEKIPYFENPENPRFLGYMKEKIESVLNISKRFPNNRDIDFELNILGTTFTVKHLISCCRYSRQYYEHYSFIINYNKVPRSFLLSTYDRKSLEFTHLWLILSKNFVRNGKSKKIKAMWNRHTYIIIDSSEMINYMKKFELSIKLEKLRKLNLYKLDNGWYNDLTTALLFDKQKEIFDTTSKKRSIEYLIENAIKLGFGNTLNLSVSEMRQKLLDEKLRKERDKYFGINKEEYENDAYNLVLDRQKLLFEITGEVKSIKELIQEGVESGIDNIFV